MASVSYAPGGGTAMAGDCCWLLIDAAPDSAVVAEIWRHVSQGPRLDTLVAGMAQFGFEFLPDFALLLAPAGGRRHLLCRGGGRATLVAASSATGIDGTGAATWLDYPVPPDVTTIVLGQPPAESELRLPVAAGIFLASGVIVSLAGEATAPPLSSGPVLAPPIPNVSSLPPFSSPSPAAGPLGPGPMAMPPEPEQPAVFAEPAPGPGADEPDPEDRAYDFLWEHTQMRTVEDAAIRPDSGDTLFALQAPDFGPQEFGAREFGTQDWDAQDFGAEGFGAPDFAALQPPESGGPAEPSGSSARSASSAAPPGGLCGLIDSVPGWAVPDPPATEPVRTVVVDGFAGDDEPLENTAMTIRRSELRSPVPVPTVHDQIGPTVHALVCMRSHLSPPSSAECRVCGEPLPQQDPVIVPRPPLGILRLSSGDLITLNQGVVMGRNPRAEFDGDERLHMVKLSSDGDISRTHVKVTLDGWHVLVTDMKSTNGTLVELPGRPPERLRAGEPVPIPHGTVITLADGIYFRYEVTE